MLEKLIAAALMRQPFGGTLVREELERLERGGYLSHEDLETLLRRGSQAMGDGLQEARGALRPVLAGLGRSIREALDLPSREEVRSLTAALEQVRLRECQPGERHQPEA